MVNSVMAPLGQKLPVFLNRAHGKPEAISIYSGMKAMKRMIV